MDADGTVTLDLLATGDGGLSGHAQLRYAPTDEQYDEIIDHIGSMKPGDVAPVPCWPDPDEGLGSDDS